MLRRLSPLGLAPLALRVRGVRGWGGRSEEGEGTRPDVPSAEALRSCLSEESERACRARLGEAQEPGGGPGRARLGEAQEPGGRPGRARLGEAQEPGGRPGRAQTASAGVLVPLCSVAEEASLLLTLRSSKLTGRHQGDVSFPGGKRDPSDPDIIHTALRETHEELGLELSRDCVWGTLRPYPDGSGMTVVPVLAHLGAINPKDITPNPKEVDDVFVISLRHCFCERNQRYTSFRPRGIHTYTLPVYLNAKYKVWGLTAVMIDGLLCFLFPGTYRSPVHGKQPKSNR